MPTPSPLDPQTDEESDGRSDCGAENPSGTLCATCPADFCVFREDRPAHRPITKAGALARQLSPQLSAKEVARVTGLTERMVWYIRAKQRNEAAR